MWSLLCLSPNSDHQNLPGTNSASRGIESFSIARPDKQENDRFGLASLDTLLGDLQSMKSVAAWPRELGYTIRPWAGPPTLLCHLQSMKTINYLPCEPGYTARLPTKHEINSDMAIWPREPGYTAQRPAKHGISHG